MVTKECNMVHSSSSKKRKLLEGSLDDQKMEEVCIYLIEKSHVII